MSVRLNLALEAGDLILPDRDLVSVLLPSDTADLSRLPQDRVQVMQPFRPSYDHFGSLGFDCQTEAPDSCAASILFLPRAKAQARALIAQANANAENLIIVDGAKTDGIDSLLKDVGKRVQVEGVLSKAHGKLFWFEPNKTAFADWASAPQTPIDGFVTAPGVFSADGIDPASRLLADTLPQKLGRFVADLGAGWGYLSDAILRDPKIETLHLVEADHNALSCARTNVRDQRARFHWADATSWKSDGTLDAVVMNPPFHTGRTGDPGLGQTFIESAARLLGRSGQLWLVANRHLPYEATLNARFVTVQEVAGDTRFKVLHATRPRR